MGESVFSLLSECVMCRFDENVKNNCLPFTCCNDDLDEFFSKDYALYADEMLGKTYCWVTISKPHKIVALVTLANDSIKTRSLVNRERNKLQRKISNPKRGRSYPAVLIGRLGVNMEFQSHKDHIGSQLMDFIKKWFRHEDNKTGCRFIVVDAYNTPSTLHYYLRNDFVFLHSNEDDEKLYYDIPADETLNSRLMYFDLKIK